MHIASAGWQISAEMELSRRFVFHDQNRVGHSQCQILVTVVVEVYKQRARGVIEPIDTRLTTAVARAAVAVLDIQPVGQAARLAKVDIVQPVPVDVAQGQGDACALTCGVGGIAAPVGTASRKRGREGVGVLGFVLSELIELFI